MGDPIPAPTNRMIQIVQIILNTLIEGVGVDLAISAAVSAEPWLAWPIVNQIFKWVVEQIAASLDQDLFKIAVKLVIRAQSTERKQEFNDAIIPIVQGNPSPAEIQAAISAADRLIERNR